MEPKASRSPEYIVREIKRKTRRKFNSEERIRKTTMLKRSRHNRSLMVA